MMNFGRAGANHGLLVIDKPPGLTSRDVVNRVQRRFPRGTRLGHTGTLDPLASGVLILCVGNATRLAEYIQAMAKAYEARLRLGAKSDTDDADGTITPVDFSPPPEEKTVAECLQAFVGEIEQVPPVYSAAHVGGRRAYDLARRGRDVSLSPRKIRIHALHLRAYAYPFLDIEVRCGKGTYIRSLARDLGDRLGCGALIETLRRTQVGSFRAEDALNPDADFGPEHLLPTSRALADLPPVVLSPEDALSLQHGRPIPLPDGPWIGGQETALFTGQNELVGVGRVEPATQSLRPVKIIRG